MSSLADCLKNAIGHDYFRGDKNRHKVWKTKIERAVKARIAEMKEEYRAGSIKESATVTKERAKAAARAVLGEHLENVREERAEVLKQLGYEPGKMGGGVKTTTEAVAKTKAVSTTKPGATGTQTSIYLPNNTKVDVRYRLVEVDDLIVSHDYQGRVNPDYPGALQPRDRERAASKLQIQKMAANLNPELLGANPSAANGSPVVGADNVVESGNARSIAIKQAYRGGFAKAYKQWLWDHAEEFGFGTEQVNSIKRPVLVRERLTDIDRVEFSRQANENTMAAMSAAEQARVDAERITATHMDSFNVPEDGNVLAGSNRSFVRSFIAMIGQEEAARYFTKDGQYTKQLADRIQTAVFQKAYADERLLALVAEEADPDIKNILNTLNKAAPEYAKARLFGIADDIDIVPYISEAAGLIQKAKAKGATLEQFLAQQSMFSKPSVEAIRLARYFQENMRSAKRMAEALSEMGRLINSELRRSQNAEMFPRQRLTARDIIAAALKRAEELHGEAKGQQQTLIARRATKGGNRGGEQVGRRRTVAGGPESEGRGTDGEPHYSLVTGQLTNTLTTQQLESHISPIARSWKNGPAEIKVLANVSQVEDEELRARAEAEQERTGSKVEGFYDPDTGTVYLFSDNLSSTDRAEQVLLHEVVGHLGLESMLGRERFENFLQQVVSFYGKHGLKSIADARQLDLNTKEGRLLAAKEKLAQMAEKGEKPAFLKRVYAAVREFFRGLGFKIKLSDADIQAMLAWAGEYVATGERQEGATKGPGGIAEVEGKVAPEAEGEGPAFSLTEPISTVLNKVQAALVKEPDNSDLHVVFGSTKDMGIIESLFKIPAWAAKTNKTVKDFFGVQQNRAKSRVKNMHELIQAVSSTHDLNDAEKQQFTELAYDLDGGEIFKGSSFVEVGKRMVQKGINMVEIPIMAVNPDYHAAIRAELKKRNVPEKIADTYMAARQTLDRTWIMAYDKLAELRDIDPDLIKQYRTEMGNIPQYWPHNRYGNYYIRAVDPTAKVGEETRYREHFTSPTERYSQVWYAKNIDRIIKEMSKKDPEIDWKALEWEVAPIKNMPETVYEHPLPIDAMQQIINAASDRMPDEIRTWVRKQMSEEVSNQLKMRGFGSHFIRRKGVPGYDQTDAVKVLHDQIIGFAGWLSKVEAAHDFSQLLSKLDARAAPQNYAWAAKYTQDMLQNQGKVDRFVDAAKSWMFLNWLGGNMKNLVVNLTQNVILGTPRLGKDVGIGHANKQWAKAMADIRLTVSEEGVAHNPRLTEQERGFLGEMFAEGWGRGQLLAELKGRMSSGPGKVFNKANNILGWPMDFSERYNRLSLGLAAFRAAREGKITNKNTLAELGLTEGKKADYAIAKKFAEGVVNDAHFIFEKGNRPGAFRGGAGGKLASTAYTFRTFSHNLLSAWRWMLTNGDREGKKAFAASMLGIMALGGVGSIPLYQTLAALIRQLFGRDPLESELRKEIPPAYRDLVMYGAPSAFGVNIGGSLGMELPIADRLKVHQGWKGQTGEAMGSLLGVPYALWQQYADAFDAYRAGNTSRALETASPAILKNILAAHRLTTEGQTTVSGKPIAVPGERQARKLGTGEAVAKGLGFQPLSSTKSWEMHRSLTEIQAFRDEKLEEWANRYVQAKRTGDSKEMVAIKEQVRDWNRKVYEEGRKELRVDLTKAIQSRLKPAKPMKQMRGYARELRETYGM